MQEYNLTIVLPEGEEKELKVSEAITLKTLAEEFEQYYDDQIILAMIDGKLRELNKKVDRSGKLSFITVADRDGKKPTGAVCFCFCKRQSRSCMAMSLCLRYCTLWDRAITASLSCRKVQALHSQSAEKTARAV